MMTCTPTPQNQQLAESLSAKDDDMHSYSPEPTTRGIAVRQGIRRGGADSSGADVVFGARNREQS
jgi:hypothetical protein